MITGHDNLSMNEPRGQRSLRNLKSKPFSFQLPNGEGFGLVWYQRWKRGDLRGLERRS
jgi:hypothetical protein